MGGLNRALIDPRVLQVTFERGYAPPSHTEEERPGSAHATAASSGAGMGMRTPRRTDRMRTGSLAHDVTDGRDGERRLGLRPPGPCRLKTNKKGKEEGGGRGGKGVALPRITFPSSQAQTPEQPLAAADAPASQRGRDSFQERISALQGGSCLNALAIRNDPTIPPSHHPTIRARAGRPSQPGGFHRVWTRHR